MGDKPRTEWTDRGGRRVRFYVRTTPDRPGQRDRRRLADDGLKYCRDCRDWRPLADVRNGLCRFHRNEEYRRNYASRPGAIRARIHARKRKIAPIPAEAILIAELFGNSCSYCGGPFESWDHVVPVKLGGQTEAGNILPACKSCNSSKKAASLSDWLGSGRGRITDAAAEYLVAMNEGI